MQTSSEPQGLDTEAGMSAAALLEIEQLCCGFQVDGGYQRVVDGVSFGLAHGQTLGLVGESGCGKTVTALSIMGLLPRPAGIIESGRILFDGIDLAAAEPKVMRRIRGKRIAMIFQEPMTALNPVHRIGRQISESLSLYEPGLDKRALTARATELLAQVGIPAPAARLREYPHQLSGGMRQRVMIAMALAGKPDILIADEPTTALDVTVQAQILDLLRSLQAEYGMAILFITHDLGVVAELCDEVIVMYAGRIAEHAAVPDLFASPRHPYTSGLIQSIPTPETPAKSILPVIEGVVPALSRMPPGCRFSTRCDFADDLCRAEVPPLERAGSNHEVSCHHWERIAK
jgi:peptide/nickel transport system ATP-binding protein